MQVSDFLISRMVLSENLQFVLAQSLETPMQTIFLHFS